MTPPFCVAGKFKRHAEALRQRQQAAALHMKGRKASPLRDGVSYMTATPKAKAPAFPARSAGTRRAGKAAATKP